MSGKPKEVLIVEDEPFTRMGAADALSGAGLQIREASDAREALQLLSDHPQIGLLFTDIDVPGDMDGLALAENVYAARPDMQFVVTSGAKTVTDRDLPDHGTFLSKPYAPDRLVQIVKRKLDG